MTAGRVRAAGAGKGGHAGSGDSAVGVRRGLGRGGTGQKDGGAGDGMRRRRRVRVEYMRPRSVQVTCPLSKSCKGNRRATDECSSTVAVAVAAHQWSRGLKRKMPGQVQARRPRDLRQSIAKFNWRRGDAWGSNLQRPDVGAAAALRSGGGIAAAQVRVAAGRRWLWHRRAHWH